MCAGARPRSLSPQQTAGLRNLSRPGFVARCSSSTRFDGRLLLRGVYFTSGTQEARRSTG